MFERMKARNVRLSKRLALSGMIATCAIAVAMLGRSGLIASLVFMPLMLTFLANWTTETATRVSKLPDGRSVIANTLSRFLGETDKPTISMVIEIDDFQRLEDLHDRDALDDVLTFFQSVIESHLDENDVTVRLDGACFASALSPNKAHDLETMLNTSRRIQQSLRTAQLFPEFPVQLTASIGFASCNKLKRPTGTSLLQAAFTALVEARRKGPGAVRGYSDAMSSKRTAQILIGKEASAAFGKGEIFSYFQPQISLKDGSLTGFEALTRWHHPTRGIIAPADFLPVLETSGLMETLGETMVRHALQAITYWDKSGIHVPRIGVNFSKAELSDPLLVERIAMLLDASGIEPKRFVIEVLETVVSNEADDDIICNLAALADLGCGIDLDDFGTGYASITNIRRFSVGRIKVDRSFVAGLDTDIEQRSMVAAILTMAERLGVTTLAEGVETKGELSALSDLGCDTAQGFHIARPMPLSETVDWVNNYVNTKTEPVPLAKRAV